MLVPCRASYFADLMQGWISTSRMAGTPGDVRDAGVFLMHINL